MTKEVHRDDKPFPFGKYKGQTPNEVSDINPGYIVWAYANLEGRVSRSLFLACSDEVDDYDAFDPTEFLND